MVMAVLKRRVMKGFVGQGILCQMLTDSLCNNLISIQDLRCQWTVLEPQIDALYIVT